MGSLVQPKIDEEAPIKSLSADESVVDKQADNDATAIFRYLVAQKHSQEGNADKASSLFRKIIDSGYQSADLMTSAALEEASLSHYDVALDYLEKALKENPDDATALQAKARILAEKGDYSTALAIFTKLLEKNPDEEEYLDAIVQIHVSREDYVLAERALVAYLQKNPESEYALYRMGLLQRAAGKLVEARKTLEKLLVVAPDSYQGAAQLARIYEEQGEKQKALEIYEWLARATNNPTYHWMLALLYTEMKKFDQAIGAFENLARTKTLDDQTKLMMLSVKAHQQVDLKNVEIELAKLAEKSPDNESVKMVLAEVYQMDGKPELALTMLEKVKGEDRNYLEALTNRMRLLLDLKKVKELKSLLDSLDLEAILDGKEEDKKGRLMSEVAYYYSKLDDFTAAHKTLDAGLKSFPKNVQLLYMKGIVLEKQERMDEAVVAMEKVIGVDEHNAAALNFVGYSWADRGIKLDMAEKYVRRALVEQPNDPYFTDSLGWVLFKRGQYKEALAELKKAEEALPKESVVAAHLGDVYMRLGQGTEARRLYKKALELGPEKESEKHELENKLAKLQDGPNDVARKPTGEQDKEDCLDPSVAHNDPCFVELRDKKNP